MYCVRSAMYCKGRWCAKLFATLVLGFETLIAGARERQVCMLRLWYFPRRPPTTVGFWKLEVCTFWLLCLRTYFTLFWLNKVCNDKIGLSGTASFKIWTSGAGSIPAQFSNMFGLPFWSVSMWCSWLRYFQVVYLAWSSLLLDLDWQNSM